MKRLFSPFLGYNFELAEPICKSQCRINYSTSDSSRRIQCCHRYSQRPLSAQHPDLDYGQHLFILSSYHYFGFYHILFIYKMNQCKYFSCKVSINTLILSIKIRTGFALRYIVFSAQ